MIIKLAIADKDQVYAEKLIKYLSCNYSDKLEIYYFTEVAEFHNFIKKNKVDIVISTETFGVDLKQVPERTIFVYFSESTSIDTINDKRTICKYQKIDLIYKEIISIYAERTTNFGYKVNEGDTTKLITFVSCSGGTGSSTTAAACAINFTRMGKKVLYLNLERFGTANLFFNAEGTFNIGDIIYAIKSKKTNLSLKLESTVKRDISGVYFYDPTVMAMDILELDVEDIKKLIDEVKITGGYDYIIVDTDFTLDKKIALLFDYSNNIVFVSDGKDVSNAKFLRAYKAMEVLEEQRAVDNLAKTFVLYNKFSSKNSKFMQDINITVLGGIPRYESPATKDIAMQISQMRIFDQLI